MWRSLVIFNSFDGMVRDESDWFRREWEERK
jgi:hypothetical protein